MMTLDEAIRLLRSEPRYSDLIRDAYLDADVHKAAERFRVSGEFAAVRRLLGERLRGVTVLDLGAGSGIASYAFACSGAARVLALEPDSSDEVGNMVIRRLAGSQPIEVICGVGEHVPLSDEAVDAVYARQVLHHTRDMNLVLRECARVMRRGGTLLVCREHVVDDAAQLDAFLSSHPVHQLAGGENAFPLARYRGAILDAGFRLERVLGPWDSIINAFPSVRSQPELSRLPRTMLTRRFGHLGLVASLLPGAGPIMWRRINRPFPGRMYTFLASKP